MILACFVSFAVGCVVAWMLSPGRVSNRILDVQRDTIATQARTIEVARDNLDKQDGLIAELRELAGLDNDFRRSK